MSLTEAQKRASAKYQRENIASLACRVKKAQAEKFRVYCTNLGKTSNAVLRDYVLDCINEIAERDVSGASAGGGSILTPETLLEAQEAAQAAGETAPQFISRAVTTQAKRDKMTHRIGSINHAERDKEKPAE